MLKTADELRISDWSSDVCSSDLLKCYDRLARHALDIVVAAGPRFLKCYDGGHLEDAHVVVAAGPRFLKCYDRPGYQVARTGVAAGPRFLKCYDGAREHRSIPSVRSEEHTSELQSLMRISYAVLCLKKKNNKNNKIKQTK